MDSNIEKLSGVTNNNFELISISNSGSRATSFSMVQRNVHQEKADGSKMYFANTVRLPCLELIRNCVIKVGTVGLLLLAAPLVSVLTSIISVGILSWYSGNLMCKTLKRKDFDHGVFKNIIKDIAVVGSGVVGAVIGAVGGFAIGFSVMSLIVFTVLRKLSIFNQNKEDKYRRDVLIETNGLDGAELVKYCHDEGLSVNQIIRWRIVFIIKHPMNMIHKIKFILVELAKYKKTEQAAADLKRDLKHKHRCHAKKYYWIDAKRPQHNQRL